ncbi:hypothetical protein B6D60_06915 [candidate division KSB1 bacterium 4484_87]|nr:MAG: hypothetical protein B6D60_06915 [candidate division KSB1 bacterium 4484_87]
MGVPSFYWHLPIFFNIFQWDVDFFLDPQIGDEFEILFQREFESGIGKFCGYGKILYAAYHGRKNDFYAFFFITRLRKMGTALWIL